LKLFALARFYIFVSGSFGSTYLSLSTDVNTCETIWESLWKLLMTCPKVVVSLLS
jgi:hypothetical protein